MARSVHWVFDPRFSHLRSPPAWWHRYPGPHYVPSPAARMEKRIAEERRAEWQWFDTHSTDGNMERSCVEACFCPCEVYGRTWARLKAALSGQDAENMPEQGLINHDCAEFVFCFPFYGCLVAKLQATVRSFYGIDGDDFSDWRDGWCCPCITLERNEYEILARERQHNRLKQLHIPCNEDEQMQYQPTIPMVYDKAKEVDSRSDAKQPQSDGDIGSEYRSPSRGPEPATTAILGTVDIKTAAVIPHVLTDHKPVAGHIVQPGHKLETDMVSITSCPKIEHSHALQNDPIAPKTQSSKPVPHDIDIDVKAAVRD